MQDKEKNASQRRQSATVKSNNIQTFHRPDDLLPEKIRKRIFHIYYRGNSGTGFTINVAGKEYLITARHVVQNMMVDTDDILYYTRNGQWVAQQVKLLHVGESIHLGGDWAVIAGFDLSSNVPHLDFTVAGWHPGQEVYFYGFPHNFRVELPENVNDNFPVPLLKTGAISGYSSDEDQVPIDIYIDAFGNPGFSGGPLICRDRKDKGKLKVTGIVKSFYSESLGNNPYQTNSGIMFASSIRFLLSAIPHIEMKT